MLKVYADAGNWVTINGVHVLIGGNGKIVKGPAKFIGSTIADMKNVGKSTADKKAELKKKLAEKKAGKSSGDSSKTMKKESDSAKFGGEYKERFSDKSSDEIRESIGAKSMTDSQINARIKSLDKTLFDTNPRDGTTTPEWRDAYSEQKALRKELSSRGSFKPTTDSLRELQVGDSISFTNSFGEKETFVKTTNPSGRKSDPPTFVYADESGNPKSMSSASNRVSVFGPSELAERASLGQSSATVSKGAVPDISRRVNRKINGFSDETGSSAYDRVTGSSRYPSGITTPAQKRAYTRAINSGMSSSDAKKSALGKATNTSSSDMSTFKKGATTTSKTTGKYTADNIPKIAGASKSVMRKTADLMNKGYSFDDAFDEALLRNGYGMGTRRGMFR